MKEWIYTPSNSERIALRNSYNHTFSNSSSIRLEFVLVCADITKSYIEWINGHRNYKAYIKIIAYEEIYRNGKKELLEIKNAKVNGTVLMSYFYTYKEKTLVSMSSLGYVWDTKYYQNMSTNEEFKLEMGNEVEIFRTYVNGVTSQSGSISEVLIAVTVGNIMLQIDGIGAVFSGSFSL